MVFCPYYFTSNGAQLGALRDKYSGFLHDATLQLMFLQFGFLHKRRKRKAKDAYDVHEMSLTNIQVSRGKMTANLSQSSNLDGNVS